MKSFHCQHLKCNELITLAVSAALVTTDAISSLRLEPVMRGLYKRIPVSFLVGNARDGGEDIDSDCRGYDLHNSQKDCSIALDSYKCSRQA